MLYEMKYWGCLYYG